MVQFPEVEVFGVKLINGRATKALLQFTNNEQVPVKISSIGGQLSSLKPLPEGTHPSAATIRNLTQTKYDIEIPAQGNKQVTYSFTTDLSPQELRLVLNAIITGPAKEQFQIRAYNGKVGVVDGATSIFDPQMYVPV